MYEDEYHFITFTLFLGLLSGFGFEIVIPEPDPTRISGLILRSKSEPFVKDQIGLSDFWVPFTVISVLPLPVPASLDFLPVPLEALQSQMHQHECWRQLKISESYILITKKYMLLN